MDYLCFVCCVSERERERERESEGERERESGYDDEIGHERLLVMFMPFPIIPSSFPGISLSLPLSLSSTHFFLWLPCVIDTQNHKRLIICFSGTVCGLWRALHFKSFYFY